MTRLSLGLSVLFTLACSGAAPDAVAPASSLLQADDVVVAAQGPIVNGPRLSGTLEPSVKAVLRAETGGSIVDLRVELGDVVAANQILARIDNHAAATGLASAQSSVGSAEQGVTIAERELQRATALVDGGALPKREQESAESRLIQARAALAGAKAQQAAQGEQVDATIVRSPIAGVVAARQVSDGDVVSPGLPLFTVIEPSSLRLEASVPASAVANLAVGTPVFFSVQGYGDQLFEGRIERVAPAVDPLSRQIPVLVSVPNANGALLAGLFAEGRVATERHDGVVVPEDAVDTEGPRPWVLKVVGGKTQRVEVGIGIVDEQGGKIEVVSGVNVGDTLVLSGARDVTPGATVEIQAPRPAAAAPKSTGSEG